MNHPLNCNFVCHPHNAQEATVMTKMTNVRGNLSILRPKHFLTLGTKVAPPILCDAAFASSPLYPYFIKVKATEGKKRARYLEVVCCNIIMEGYQKVIVLTIINEGDELSSSERKQHIHHSGCSNNNQEHSEQTQESLKET